MAKLFAMFTKKVISVTCVDGFTVVITFEESRNTLVSVDLFAPEESEIEVPELFEAWLDAVGDGPFIA